MMETKRSKHAVTKKELKQYVAWRQEIKRLKGELNSAGSVVDSVTGSTPEFPYTEATITIDGLDIRHRRRVQARIAKLTASCDRVEKFVDSIEDSFTRQLFELKFIRGYGWGKVMRKCGCTCSVDAIRMRVERYLNKIS